MFRIKTLRGRTTIFVLFVMISSSILTTIFGLILHLLNFIPSSFMMTFWMPIIVLSVSSILGTFIASIFSSLVLKPVKDIADATKKVAKGDFKVQVDDTKTFGEIQSLINNFNMMVKELDSIEMFRLDFIRNFSHEFKTPIVSILGFAKQLEKGNLSKEKEEQYIKIIMNESENLANLSANILLLTKLETQSILTDKTYFSLDEQIRHSVILLEKEWSKKNLQLELELDQINFYGNKEIMARLWVNLISNAIIASKENGLIEVKASIRPTKVVVTIKDYGVGMTKDVLERIFDKFYQGDLSRSSRGNGLGLPMVKRIVELSNGTIHVESEPDRGSIFTITFPIN